MKTLNDDIDDIVLKKKKKTKEIEWVMHAISTVRLFRGNCL
jgi:hypothetical protein